MNLEQVKEHFKYAKEVRCLSDGGILNLNKMTPKGIHQLDLDYWFDTNGESCLIYDDNTNQLAEILTYIFDRGEEVEVSSAGEIWHSFYFIGFNKKGLAVVENSIGVIFNFFYIRKITPESLLEPQLSELKKVAEANGMSVEIIFKQK